MQIELHMSTPETKEVMARALPIALLCIVASFLSAEAKS